MMSLHGTMLKIFMCFSLALWRKVYIFAFDCKISLP